MLETSSARPPWPRPRPVLASSRPTMPLVAHCQATSKSAESPASPRRLPETAGFPHGWKHAGNVTAYSIDISMVTSATLEKTVEATLRHLGGRKGPNATSPNGTYLEATVETNQCGNLTISLTTLPSRAQAFKALGCRVYFRGVKKAQHDIDEVRAWMAEMIDIVSP